MHREEERMAQEAYDELLRRLTALVVKLDDRDEQMMALLEEHTNEHETV
jgi:hypothetical protein